MSYLSVSDCCWFLCRFGHQDKITGIDVLSQERVVTSGARDGSIRIWKIVEESQLVFHGHRWTMLSADFDFLYIGRSCIDVKAENSTMYHAVHSHLCH